MLALSDVVALSSVFIVTTSKYEAAEVCKFH